jgi:hypothetical protein
MLDSKRDVIATQPCLSKYNILFVYLLQCRVRAILNNLPFPAGEVVEVIILKRPSTLPRQNLYPLRGTAVTYIDPTEPVAQADWEATE